MATLYTLRRFSSAKKFFEFTVPALNEALVPTAFYLYPRDLKSACSAKTTAQAEPLPRCASQDRARIVFDCGTAKNDPAMITSK
jgi:hypothetical protein